MYIYTILLLFIILLLLQISYKNIFHKPHKYIEFKNNKLYVFNNIDTDKLDGNSEFLIGSITKIFIIYTILILQQQKLLDIYDPIDKYIASNEINDFSNITIFDLINHTSGIKIFPNIIYKIKNTIGFFINNDLKEKYNTANSITPFFLNEKIFTFKYGEYSYSNIGYVLLGQIIEKITNLSYIDILKKYIINPLNLSHTNVGLTNIKLYNKYSDQLQLIDYNKRYFASSAGSLYSTTNDLIKLAHDGIKLLNQNSLNILKKLYIYSFENNHNVIKHRGKITGGKTTLKIIYNNHWNVIDLYIKMQTVYD